MKITDIETHLISTPMKVPITMAHGGWTIESSLIVVVKTEEGVTGVGPSNQVAKSIIDSQRNGIIGEDPFNVEKIWRKFWGSGMTTWHIESSSMAIAGIEIALWDIIGKVTAQPIHRLMGGCYREKIPMAAFMGYEPPMKYAGSAVKYVEQGFKTLKMKVGVSPQEDVECVKAVRDAVGYDIEIKVDANQAYSPAMAIRLIKKLAKYDPLYVEQPVPRWDMDGMARLHRAIAGMGVPLCLCEGVYTMYDVMNAIKKEAADFIHLDPIRCGGLLAVKKTCGMCEAADISITNHLLGGHGTHVATLLQWVASTPNIMYACDCTYDNMSDDIIKQPFKYDKDCLTVPKGPGLGIEINEEKLKEAEKRYESNKHLPYKRIEGRIFTTPLF